MSVRAWFRSLLVLVAAGCGAAPATHETPPPGPPLARPAAVAAKRPPTNALSSFDATNVTRLERVHGAYETIKDVRFGDDGGVIVTTEGSVWHVRPDGSPRVVSHDEGVLSPNVEPAARVRRPDRSPSDGSGATVEACAEEPFEWKAVVTDGARRRDVCAYPSVVSIGRDVVRFPAHKQPDGDGRMSAEVSIAPGDAWLVVTDDTRQVALVDVKAGKLVKTWPGATLPRVAPGDQPWRGGRLTLLDRGSLLVVDPERPDDPVRYAFPKCAARDRRACASPFEWKIQGGDPLAAFGVAFDRMAVAAWRPGGAPQAMTVKERVERVDGGRDGRTVIVTYAPDSSKRAPLDPELWIAPATAAEPWRKVSLPGGVRGVALSDDAKRFVAWTLTEWGVGDVSSPGLAASDLRAVTELVDEARPSADVLPPEARARFAPRYAALRADNGEPYTTIRSSGTHALRLASGTTKGATMVVGSKPVWTAPEGSLPAAFSPSGATVAYATCADGDERPCFSGATLRVIDVERGTPRYTFGKQPLGEVAFVDDDLVVLERLDTSFGRRRMVLGASALGKWVWQATCEDVGVHTALFVTSDRVVAGGGRYCIFDARTGARIADVSVTGQRIIETQIHGVSVEANELYANLEGTTFRWSLDRGNPRPSLPHRLDVAALGREERNGLIAHAGSRVAVTADEAVVVHDATTGAVLRRVELPGRKVRSVALAPSGLIGVGTDAGILLFGEGKAPIARVACGGDAVFTAGGRVLSCEQPLFGRALWDQVATTGIWVTRDR